MQLQVQNLIRFCDIFEPHLVLDIPPSDNTRKTRNRQTGFLIATKEVKQYREYVAMELKTQPEISLPKPPVVLLYRAYFTSRKRDSQNIAKVLVDALYKQDRLCVPWPLPPRHKDVDKESPHVDIWFVKVLEDE